MAEQSSGDGIKVEGLYRSLGFTCAVCPSLEDVRSLVFTSGNMGTRIRLCRGCRAALRKAMDDDDDRGRMKRAAPPTKQQRLKGT